MFCGESALFVRESALTCSFGKCTTGGTRAVQTKAHQFSGPPRGATSGRGKLREDPFGRRVDGPGGAGDPIGKGLGQDVRMGDFHVDSEVGRLRRVILHRPDIELKRLTPTNKDELLFDEVLWAER